MCGRENGWDISTLAPFMSEFVDSTELFIFEFQKLVNKGINVWTLALVLVTVIWTGWSLLYFLCSERWRTDEIISKHKDSRRLSGSSDIQHLGCIIGTAEFCGFSRCRWKSLERKLASVLPCQRRSHRPSEALPVPRSVVWRPNHEVLA